MADITITIPNSKLELLKNSAEFAVCGEYPIPANSEMTPQEVQAWVKAYLVDKLKYLVRAYIEAKWEGDLEFIDPTEE